MNLKNDTGFTVCDECSMIFQELLIENLELIERNAELMVDIDNPESSENDIYDLD